MNAVKIVLAVLGIVAILFSFLGALLCANNPRKRTLRFYRICLIIGIILMIIAIYLYLFH